MMFCLSGGDNIISEKMELFMDCYNPIHNYENTLNLHLRQEVLDTYEYWLEGIPQTVHRRLEEKQVVFEIGDVQVVVQCRPNEWDDYLSFDFNFERRWLDEMNLFGPRITSIYEVYEDGTEKKIFEQSPEIKPIEKKVWKKRKNYKLPPLPPQAEPASIEFTRWEQEDEETLGIGGFIKGDGWDETGHHNHILLTPCTQPIMNGYAKWTSRSYNGMFFQKKDAPKGVGLIDTDEGIFLCLDEKGEKIEEVEGGFEKINLDDYPGLREWLNYYYGQ
jgi:hypothetical protein